MKKNEGVYTVCMISAVVLAAGASSRMGRQKLLLPLGDEPLVRRTVRQVAEAGFDEVLVIVGREHEQVVAALEGLPVRHAVNPDYESGMGSSFRAAVASLPDSAAALFALADQPLLLPSDYRRLLEAYRARPGGIIGVRYGDVTAPPHLFARRYFPELARLTHGARAVLQRHEDDTTVVPFDPALLLDVDTPGDYERARAALDDTRHG
jgi:molybdenum cofactor cytidylyltransferase